MASTILEIIDFVNGQSNPAQTINEAVAVLEASSDGMLTVDSSGDSDVTLTDTGDRPRQWHYGYIEVDNTGSAWTAQRNLNVPANTKRYIVYNNNGAAFNCNVQVTGGGGAGVAIANGKTAVVQCDGTDVLRVTDDTA